MNKDVYAVVVTFNRAKLLKKCLESIRNQTYEVKKIIIINNASTDETKKVLENIESLRPFIDIIHLNRNIGGAGGFAYGMLVVSQMRPDYIWIMDDDVEPASNCLEELISSFDLLGERADAVCPKVYGAHLKGYQLYHHKQLSPYLMDRQAGNLKKETSKIDANAFVGPLFRGDVAKRYGLPISKYFIWSDDLEYTFRIGRLGRLFLNPDAIINHNDVQGRRVAWKSYFGFRNYTDFVKINSKDLPLKNIFMSYALLTYRSIKACFGFLLQATGDDRRKFYLPLLGYWDGLTDFWERPIGPLAKSRPRRP